MCIRDRLNAKRVDVIEYFNIKIKEALKEEQEIRDNNLEKEKTNTEIIKEVMDRKNKAVDIAIGKHKALGDEIDINAEILASYKTAIISLTEQGIFPSNTALKQLIANYNQLKETMNDGIEELTATQKIMNRLKESMETASKKGEAFGDSFDVATTQARYLRTAINSLIEDGIEPQDEGLQELIKRYNELKTQSEDTLSSIVDNTQKAASATEKLSHAEGFRGFGEGQDSHAEGFRGFGEGWDLTGDGPFEPGRKFVVGVRPATAAELESRVIDSNYSRSSSEAPMQTRNDNSVTTQNDITINQNITDKATADYAADKIANKLQGRGVGGSFL